MYPENYNMLETFFCHLSSLITPPYPTTRLQWICPSRGHAPPSALNAMRPSPCGQGSISLAVVLFFPKRKSKYHSLPLPHRPRGGKHTVNFYSSPPPLFPVDGNLSSSGNLQRRTRGVTVKVVVGAALVSFSSHQKFFLKLSHQELDTSTLLPSSNRPFSTATAVNKIYIKV